ncbi:MAG: hypothetical protein R3F34_12935 [Planctomycetota bacterium]
MMATLARRSAVLALALLTALVPQEPDDAPREGSPEEIGRLILAWEGAKLTDDSAAILRTVREMRPFKNDDLLVVVRHGVEHEGTRTDRNRILAGLDPAEREDEDLVDTLVTKLAAQVVAASADIGARMGTRDSLAALEKGLRAKSTRDNPYAFAALVEALSRHPVESTKVTKEVTKHLLEFDDAKFELPGHALVDDRLGTPRADGYRECAHYFERRGTKERDVYVALAEALHDEDREGVTAKKEKRGDAYRIGREAAASVLAPTASAALLALTGRTFETSAEGRSEALTWIADNAKSLGLR